MFASTLENSDSTADRSQTGAQPDRMLRRARRLRLAVMGRISALTAAKAARRALYEPMDQELDILREIASDLAHIDLPARCREQLARPCEHCGTCPSSRQS